MTAKRNCNILTQCLGDQWRKEREEPTLKYRYIGTGTPTITDEQWRVMTAEYSGREYKVIDQTNNITSYFVMFWNDVI